MSAFHALRTFTLRSNLPGLLREKKMHLWPHLREFLLGPLGIVLLVWLIAVLWLGAKKRMTTLGLLLACSAILMAVVAYEAFEMSAVAYSPSRDMPLVASGLFITFSLAALICGAMAVALLAAPLLDRLRSR
jgi:uncharacterized membrane protein